MKENNKKKVEYKANKNNKYGRKMKAPENRRRRRKKKMRNKNWAVGNYMQLMPDSWLAKGE